MWINAFVLRRGGLVATAAAIAAGGTVALAVGPGRRAEHRTVFAAAVDASTAASDAARFAPRDSSLPAEAAIPESQRRGEATILEWTPGVSLDRLNKGDPEGGAAKRRHVIALIGFTGAGKSSTANTLLKSTRTRPFGVSGSMTSLTRSVEARDFELRKVPFRVIDTPGLGDTNRSADAIAEELARLASYAPHGVSAFLVVVPHGRMTSEQEEALRNVRHLFGDSVAKHTIVVVTHALDKRLKQVDTRDVLLEKLRGLPPRHFLRTLVDAADQRVLGVENVLEPWRTRAQLQMLQSVLELEHDAGRYDCSHFISERKQRVAAAWAREGEAAKNGGRPACKHSVTPQKDGSVELRLRCEPGPGVEVPAQLAQFLAASGTSKQVKQVESPGASVVASAASGANEGEVSGIDVLWSKLARRGRRRGKARPKDAPTQGVQRDTPAEGAAETIGSDLDQFSAAGTPSHAGMTDDEMRRMAMNSPGIAFFEGKAGKR